MELLVLIKFEQNLWIYLFKILVFWYPSCGPFKNAEFDFGGNRALKQEAALKLELLEIASLNQIWTKVLNVPIPSINILGLITWPFQKCGLLYVGMDLQANNFP